jgi:hypothetical protein
MVQLKIKKISMQGFNIAEAGHVAILPPKSISGLGPDQSGVLDEEL